ncbi:MULTISPECIES: KpsF/GutQ family sugar-phosphate isomerase [Enterobacteriaceae]|uniref:KpsF/GutQ family sugar-phosphate isomerase n=1 Tax=Gammaproteobacteria TaxID=1236 RepID=UPI001F1DF740|nr:MULTISPECIES: KpsF/GutQ family sugar-phosphate isomerase [Enterobacteriaceae]MCM6296130.1 KpsF/GutQ family sugar-phosphate isomerase [Klebsiella pneumoniae]WGG65741.1 KpsF/GutQ family sugar-phosphate isomerase [Enterobacter ludwigii]HBW1955731.1 KpsF/GutQ family sugar-phosphate isomerase [Klebsiella pneumoniae]
MNAIEIAKDVIECEIDGLKNIISLLDNDFTNSINLILNTQGRVIISGMGKSGIIGRKIAASMASTGTPSFFMHPGEAFHGDLGMVASDDIFIAISNSGETDEVLKLLPFLEDNKNKIIAITGNPKSTLAKSSSFHLNIAVAAEACPFQLAPTSSTTATLAMGDALAITLMRLRNFKPENFARFHPGGALGRKLLRKVRDEMQSDQLPIVNLHDDFSVAINAMSSGNYGLVVICDNLKLSGIITDGDLRRAIDKYGRDIFDLKVSDMVKLEPYTIEPSDSISYAYDLMEEKNITSLIVVDHGRVVGILKK